MPQFKAPKAAAVGSRTSNSGNGEKRLRGCIGDAPSSSTIPDAKATAKTRVAGIASAALVEA